MRCKNFKEKKIHKKLNKLKPYELIGINLLKRYLIFDTLSYEKKKKVFYNTDNFLLI